MQRFYGNTFDCTSDIKKPWNGAPVGPSLSVGNKSLAGVWTESTTFVTIGTVGTNPNIFQNVRIGIKGVRTNLRVINSQFIKIQRDPLHYLDQPTGAGIQLESEEAGFYLLELEGLGTDLNSDPITFDQLRVACEASGYNIIASESIISNVRRGFDLRSAPFQNFSIDLIDIFDNNITASAYCIYLNNLQFPNTIKVHDNHLQATGTGIGFFNMGTAIFLGNCLGNEDGGIDIYRNPISLINSSRNGIHLQNSSGVIVRDHNGDENIRLESNQNRNGILIQGGQQNKITFNQVESISTTNLHTGMNIENSSFNEFCCNETNA